MIAATLYCAIATFRTVAGLRSEDTVVIITQLPAAQAINATRGSPIETLFQRNRVSSISVNGCQLSAATRPRLPNASRHASVRQPLDRCVEVVHGAHLLPLGVLPEFDR